MGDFFIFRGDKIAKKDNGKMNIVGMIFGFLLVVIPEPTTTILGLGIMAFTAYKMGWLGKSSV